MRPHPFRLLRFPRRAACSNVGFRSGLVALTLVGVTAAGPTWGTPPPPPFQTLPIAAVDLHPVGEGVVALSAASFESKTEVWEIDAPNTRLLVPRLDETIDRFRMVAGNERAFVLGGALADEVWGTDPSGLLPLAEENRVTPLAVRGDRFFFLRHNDLVTSPPSVSVDLAIVDASNGDLWISPSLVSYSGSSDQAQHFAATPLVTHRGRDYFMVLGDSASRGLWRTDGTPFGTVRVAGWPASCAICGEIELVSNGKVLLLAAGGELWRLTIDVNGVFRNARRLTALADARGLTLTADRKTVFFSGTTASTGVEPWLTDGTPGGTRLLRDISVGATGSDPKSIVAFGNGIVFTARHPSFGREVWRTTSKPVKAGAPPVWKTQRIAEIAPGAASAVADAARLVAVGGQLLFAAGIAGQDTEPWITNGTAAGTHRLLDLSTAPAGSEPTLFTVTHDRVYFRARLDTGISLIWIERSALAP